MKLNFTQSRGFLCAAMRYIFIVFAAFVFSQTTVKAQTALNFTGSQSTTVIPVPALQTANSAFTVEIWMKPSDNGTFFKGTPVSFNSVGGSTGKFFIQYQNFGSTAGTYNLEAYIYGTQFGGTVNNVLIKDKWNHVAVVVNPSVNDFRIYVNGALQYTYSGTQITNSNIQGVNVQMGAQVPGGENMIGAVDELRVWQGSRTSAEILNNYFTSFSNTTAAATPNLLVDVNFEGESPTTQFTNRANNNGVTNAKYAVNGATYISPDPFVAGALNFVKTAPLSGNYITVPHSSSLNLAGDFTIEAWVNYSGFNSTIIDKGDYDYLFQLNCSNPGFSPNRIDFYNRNTNQWVHSTGTVPENTWTHVAITLTGGVMTFYINGVASGTANVTFTQDSGPVNIGRQQPVSCQCNSFNGTMDELRIWNRALTQCEINTNKSCEILNPTSQTSLVGYYKFNQGSMGADNSAVTSLTDASAYGNNGSLVGFTLNGTTSNWVAGNISGTCNAFSAPAISVTSNSPVNAGSSINLTSSVTNLTAFSWTGPNSFTSSLQNPVISSAAAVNSGTYTVTGTNGITGCTATSSTKVVVNTAATGLNFDGVNDYVAINSPYRNYNQNISVEFWMNAANPAMPYGSIMGQGVEGQDNMTNNIWLMHPNTDGTMTFYINDAGTYRSAGPVAIQTGWHHIAGVANTSGIKLYVDGVLAASGAGITGSIYNNPNSVMHIGKDVRFATGRFGNFSVDEVRVWSRSLCQSEIQNNMNCSLNASGQNGLVGLYHFDNGFVNVNNSNIANITTATDASSITANGTLFNFGLTGTASNYVAGNATGTCTSFVPSTAANTGTSAICAGANTTLSNSIAGGTWSSANTAIATVNPSTGVVTGVAAGTVNITYTNACGGVSTTAVTVNAVPTVNAVANQEVCNNGVATTAISFSGTVAGTVFNWTNNTPSIGLAASGTGNIASFVGQNTGTSPVTATITVTPSANGCTGTPITFTIRVNPTPTFNAIANQTVCNGTATSAVTFVGQVAGTTYTWSGGAAIGLANGSGATLPSFTATNTGSAPVVANILVLSNVQGAAVSCGTSRVFTITVNPIPAVSSITGNLAVCSGATTTLTASSNVTAPTINWYDASTGGNLVFTGANFTTPALSAATTYYAEAVSNGCVSPSRVAANINVTTINNQSVTVSPAAICGSGSATVTLPASQAGVSYTLRNNANNATVAGPVAGTGGAINFSTGTVSSTTTYNVLAQTGGTGALSFSGNNYVSAPHTAALNVSSGGQLTMEAWVFSTTPDTWRNIIMKGAYGYGMAIDASNRLYFWDQGAGNLNNTWSDVTVPVNQWNHVAVTVQDNGSTLGVTLYLNGVNVGNKTSPVSAINDNTDNLILGMQGTGCSCNFFTGKMDDVRIWNTVRTAAQISASMNSALTGSESGLIAYYKLDETSGTTAADTRSGNNGTLNGFTVPAAWTTGIVSNGISCSLQLSTTPTVTVNPLPVATITAGGPTTFCAGGSVTLNGAQAGPGNSLSFNGINNAVRIPDVNYAGTTSFTIEAWVKPNNITSNPYYEIARQQGAPNWIFSFQDFGTILSFGLNTTTGYSELDAPITAASFTDGNWHHVAATYDGSNCRVYKDGVLIGTSSKIGNIVYATQFGLTTFIGAYSGGEYFNGLIDEVRFWNTTRTQAQIQANMSTALAANTAGLTAYYKFDEGTGTAVNDASGNGNNGTLVNGTTWSALSPVSSGSGAAIASYAWSPGGATTSSITVTTGGSYSLQVTDVNGCTSTSAPTTVTVNALPAATITAGGPTTFCTGGSVTLTASAGSSYLWSTGAITQSITVSASGSYSVTVTNASNCSSTSSATVVTVNPLPSVSSVSGTTTICTGGSAVLTASSSATSPVFNWYNAASGGTLLFTGAVFTSPSLSAAVTYYVEVVSNGCTSTARFAVPISLIQPPTPTVSSNSPVCSGNTLTLSASGAANFSWTGPNGFTSNLQNPSIPNVTTAATGTYVVTASNNGCTGATASISVSVGQTPGIPVVSGPAIVCAGSSATLTATSSNGNIVWWDAPTGGNIVGTGSPFVVTPGNTVTYYAEGSSSSGGVIVNTLAGNALTAVEVVNQTGDDRGGIAVTQASVFINGDGGVGRFDHNLNIQAGLLPQRDGIFCDINPATSGQLWTLWNTSTATSPGGLSVAGSNGIVNAIRQMDQNMNLGLTINLSTPIALTSSPQNCCLSNAPGIFSGTGYVLLYSNVSNGWYRVDLATGNVTSLGTADGGGLNAFITENWARWGWAEYNGTNYFAVYRDASSQSIVKKNITTGAITTLAAYSSLSDMANIIYSPWDNRAYMHHEGTAQFRSGDESLEDVSGTSTTGGGANCNSTARTGVTLTVVSLPVAAITAGGSTALCPGTTVTLSANSGAGYTYQWYNNGQVINGATGINYTANNSGNYTVVITNSNGCISAASNAIVVTTDVTPPVIVCAANQTINLNANCSVSLPDYRSLLAVSDNCTAAGSLTITQNPAAGTVVSGTGNITVSFTVTDAAGNSSNCSITVTKRDVTGPVITGPSNINVNTDPNKCGAVVNYQPSSSIVFSQNFVQGPTNSTYCSAWTTFLSQLSAGNTYSKLTIKGTFDQTGVSVTDPVVIAQIANALRTGGSGTWTTGGRTWAVGDCGGPGALSATNGSLCSCESNGYVVRPCINQPSNSNPNWGGVNTAVCNGPSQNITVVFDIAGSGNGGVTATDACSGNATVTQTAGLASGATFPVGTTVNTFVATDASGNQSTYSFNVVVTDNQLPVISVPSNITTIATGANGAVVNYATPTATDNCAVSVALTAGLPSGSVFPLGTTTVTYRATDASGNTATGSFTVTVSGRAPVINCPGNITVSNDPGLCSAAVTYVATETTGIPASTISYSIPSGSHFNLGTTAITVTATNSIGTSSCTFNVTVKDTEVPTVITQPVTLVLDANGNATLTAAQVDKGSKDNCGIASLSVSPSTFNCSNVSSLVNINTQTIVTDATWAESTTTYSTGNYCTTNSWSGVGSSPMPTLGSYSLAPTINAYSITPISGTQGLYGLNGVRFFRKTFNLTTLNDIKATLQVAMDNGVQIFINGVSVALKGIMGNTFNGGTPVQVVLNSTGSNVNGGSGTTAFDNITNANASSLFVVGTNEIVLALANCDATDRGAISFKATIQTNNGGPVPVVLTVTDVNGNTASAGTQVTIVDNTSPVFVTCPSNINVIATSAAGAVVNYGTLTATDNCSAVVTRTAGPASGTTFPIGTTTVTHTATDPSGNSVTCSFTVTVSGLAPVINCPANIVVSSAANACGANVNYTATETTAIPASTITYSIAPGSFFPVGTTTVTATAENAVGKSSCSFTVQVLDDVAPTVITKNITVQLDAAGTASITPDMVDGGSKDNCGVATLAVSKNNFTCADVTANNPSSSSVPSPYGWWKADGNYLDNTGNHNNGTPFLNPAFTAGNCGQAFLMNGVGSHVDVGNNNAFNGTAAMTIAAWINPNSNGDEDQIASKSDHGVPSSWEFRRYGDYLQFTYRSTDGNQYAVGASVLSFNSWQHVAATWDGSTMKLYRNGQLVASATGGPMLPNNYSMKIGENQGYGDEWGAWSGSIDELMFFTSSLSGADVAQIAGGGCNPFTNANSSNNTGTPVTLTVADIYGNSSSATAYVTVVDNIPPTVLTQNITVQLDANGNAVITPADINNGSTDNCSIASYSLDKTSFNCTNVGDNTVILTVTDVNGNSATAQATVTVEDNIVPTVITRNITVQLNAAGSVTITPAQVDNGSTDNCSVAVYSLDKTSFDCSNVGDNTVTLTVTDMNGNSASAPATVTVVDNVAPTVLTQNITVQLDANGAAVITPAQINNGSTDNCSVASYSLDKTSFDCSNVGDNTVTLTVTDVNGNSASAPATVTVVDNIAPTVITQNITVQLDASGAAVITPAQINNGSTDNCSVASYSLDKTGFNCSNIGANTVTLTVTDVNGNSASAQATVTVVDLIKPNVTAPGAYSVVNDPGVCGATIADIGTPVTSDNCGVASITNNHPSAFYPVGTTIVTWIVTDVNGNVTDTATQSITVIDNELPTISVTDVTRNADLNVCGATIQLATPETSDNCGVASVTNNHPSTFYPVGTTTVTWTVTDIYGWQQTTVQTIVVKDVQLPNVITQNITVQLDGTGNVTITPAQVNNGSNDACGIASVTVSKTSFNCSNLGANTVTLTVTDVNGNINSSTAVVTVQDKLGPVPTVAVLPTVTGQCSASIVVVSSLCTDNCSCCRNGCHCHDNCRCHRNDHSYWNHSYNNWWYYGEDEDDDCDNDGDEYNVYYMTVPTAQDNCSGLIKATTTDPLRYYTQGTYTIHWKFTDANGNSTIQEQTVIVNDNIAPKPWLTSLPTITGQCSVSVGGYDNDWWDDEDDDDYALAAPWAWDNCAGWIRATTADPLSYSTQGTYTIHWVFNDGHGNTTVQNQTVIVKDNIAPRATVGNLPTVYGQCSATVTNVPTAKDNCVGVVTGTTTDPLSYNAQGTYTINWKYNDGHGNISTQTQTVIVRDNTAPVPQVSVLPTITAECSATVTTVPKANDNCKGVITGTTTDPLTYSKEGVYTIRWTYNDGNGNTSTQNQTVIINDITAPVPTVSVLPTLTGECSVLVAAAPTANDNCKGLITATTSDPLSYSRQGTYTIRWSYNDGNGNISTQNQTVVVKDITAPIVTAPAAATVNCGGSTAPTVMATATDNCGTPTITYSDVTAGNKITRTWKATDAAGNSSTAVQVVTIVDNTAPSITDIKDVTVSCGASTDPSATGTPKATDNCSTPTVSYTDAVSGYTITRTWKATDGSGNTATSTQVITIVDNTKPVISDVADITVNCGASTDPLVTGKPTASDNCSSVTISNSDVVNGNIITRTWKATDASGNYATSTQYITIGMPFTTSVSSVPTSSTYTGGVSTNLYLGYGAQSTTLQVAGLPAAGAPYTYNWTGTYENQLSSRTTSNPVFTPTQFGYYTFSVTVTNKYGCTASCSISICVTDIRVPGSNGAKVYVTHTPNGKNAVPQTLEVALNQVAAHIQNNSCGSNGSDRLGSTSQSPCNTTIVNNTGVSNSGTAKDGETVSTTSTEEELKVTAMPNPTTTYFTLKIESKYQTPVELRVMDGRGRVVDAKSKIGANSTIQIGHNYSSGTYYAELIQGTQRKVVQLIKGRG